MNRLLLALLLNVLSIGTPVHAGDDMFPEAELVTGKKADRAECAATEHAVWVEHKLGTECIRYFPSSGIDGAARVIFFFHGDRLDGSRPISSAYRDNSAKAQLSLAQKNADQYGVPVIVVARPGAYGSSGLHEARRQPKEFQSLNATVDAIRAKHGLQRIVLAGQSGGATTVGALLTLGRTDVTCAVGTSGNYSVLELAEHKRAVNMWKPKPGLDINGYPDPYDVIDHVGGIRPDHSRRIFIVGDPEDQNTVFRLQRKFADRVRAAGHEVVLVEAHATGSQRHNLTHVAFMAGALCAQDTGTAELVREVSGP